ncbi:hypothetical protein LINGRAHAP2_LOCUS35477, partial [Linum grandiflorum]
MVLGFAPNDEVQPCYNDCSSNYPSEEHLFGENDRAQDRHNNHAQGAESSGEHRASLFHHHPLNVVCQSCTHHS